MAVSEEEEEEEEEEVLSRVFRHWQRKRSGRKVSLLRCLHRHALSHWSFRDTVPPPRTEVLGSDTHGRPRPGPPTSLTVAREELIRRRFSVDRALLAAGHLRRREGSRAELVRLAREQQDEARLVDVVALGLGPGGRIMVAGTEEDLAAALSALCPESGTRDAEHIPIDAQHSHSQFPEAPSSSQNRQVRPVAAPAGKAQPESRSLRGNRGGRGRPAKSTYSSNALDSNPERIVSSAIPTPSSANRGHKALICAIT